MSGLSSESEIVEHRVGSSSSVIKIPGKVRYGNIVLRKGCTVSGELYQWRQRIERGEDDRRSGAIILVDGNLVEKVRWNFYEAWPCRYDAPEFDASSNAIGIETLELCVQRLERVDSGSESLQAVAGGDAAGGGGSRGEG